MRTTSSSESSKSNEMLISGSFGGRVRLNCVEMVKKKINNKFFLIHPQ